MIKFPNDFLWGGAVSAEQTEGKGTTPKGETIYERQFKETPEDFFENRGPYITSGIMENYKEDIKMWRELGMNSHRTSISWARIFPEGDYTKPNKASVQFYHDFIDEMINNDITPMLTLFHFDMPMYAQDKGGWESRQVWEEFLEYSKFVLNEYGNKVNIWTTMNEPWVPVQSSYISGIQYPKVKDGQRAINAAYGIVMSHAKIVNYFNSEIKNKFPDNQIGAIFNSSIVYPKDSNNPEDVIAAKYCDLFQFTGLTDAMITGKWNPDAISWVKEMNLIPENYLEEDIKEMSMVDVDLIGLNFYAPSRAEAPNGQGTTVFSKYFSAYDMPGRRENKFRGWEIYPEALYDTMKMMFERYGDKKYMLTEYGMGVENEEVFRDANTGEINDDYRVAFIKEHLQQLHRVMQDTNINVIGAHVWATYDCWSWGNAYKNRYGLIEVDVDTLKRTPKASARFFKEFTKNGNSFESDFKKMEEYMDYDELDFSESTKMKI